MNALKVHHTHEKSDANKLDDYHYTTFYQKSPPRRAYTNQKSESTIGRLPNEIHRIINKIPLKSGYHSQRRVAPKKKLFNNERPYEATPELQRLKIQKIMMNKPRGSTDSSDQTYRNQDTAREVPIRVSINNTKETAFFTG